MSILNTGEDMPDIFWMENKYWCKIVKWISHEETTFIGVRYWITRQIQSKEQMRLEILANSFPYVKWLENFRSDYKWPPPLRTSHWGQWKDLHRQQVRDEGILSSSQNKMLNTIKPVNFIKRQNRETKCRSILNELGKLTGLWILYK